MLRNKKFNIVISLLIAVGLWVYVIGTMDPSTTKVFNTIPVTFTNTDVLAADGLAIVDYDIESISVSVSGTKSKVSKISETDIIASVDASQLVKGENKCRIDVTTPDSIELKNQSDSKITVNVEERRTESKDIEIKYEGNAQDGDEGTTVEKDKETVSVSGAKTLVAKVDHVEATIDVTSLGNEMKSIDASLVPVDKNGKKIENLELSDDSVKVVAVLYKTKTVTLTVPVIGENAGSLKREVAIPETVTIKGTQKALKDVNSLTAETLDVSQIYTDSTEKISVKLPKDVYLSVESEKLMATVTMAEEGTRTFKFSTEDIDINDAVDGRSATIESDTIKITVTGDSSDLKALKASDFDLSVKLTSHMRGTVSVDVDCSCSGTVKEMTVNPNKVKVVID